METEGRPRSWERRSEELQAKKISRPTARISRMASFNLGLLGHFQVGSYRYRSFTEGLYTL